MEEVVLVTENDEAIGSMEKMEAHKRGVLHRAFSVFVMNDKKEMLLQQRALTKYHSGGLWTNACCSHPRPDEKTEAAAMRRLKEELGFTAPLKKIFDFRYHAVFDNGLVEHEFDHVYLATYSGQVFPNPNEAMNYRYQSLAEIAASLRTNSQLFTKWFCIAFPKVMQQLNGALGS